MSYTLFRDTWVHSCRTGWSFLCQHAQSSSGVDSRTTPAGLFGLSVTSAFIIEVNSKLRPDPNEETAGLLRVLIHKVDNTTFGGDAPAVPQP